MKNVTRFAVVLVVVAALTAGQSIVMAAPTGPVAIGARSNAGFGFISDLLGLFGIGFGNQDGSLSKGRPAAAKGQLNPRSNSNISTDGAIWGGSGYRCRGGRC